MEECRSTGATHLLGDGGRESDGRESRSFTGIISGSWLASFEEYKAMRNQRYQERIAGGVVAQSPTEMYFDLCYSVSIGRVQTFQAHTQSHLVTIALVFALFHMWETSVLYSARFFEDDILHRTFFLALMCAIATGTVAVKTSNADLETFSAHYLAAVCFWLIWYVLTAFLVNVALPSRTKALTPSSLRAESHNDMATALTNLEAAALKEDEPQKCCSFMRKEALASLVSATILLLFTVGAVVSSSDSNSCGGEQLEILGSRSCIMASGFLIAGVLADKLFMSLVWTLKASWWVRLNKTYIQTRYKRMITMLLGTNVVSALMQHAANHGNDASNTLYLMEGVLLGLLIVLYYFDLSVRSSKQHALNHIASWRGTLWIWTHLFMVLGLVFWGASKINTDNQDSIRPTSTTRLAIRSAAVINVCLTVQHATHKEEVRVSRSRCPKKTRLLFMCGCTVVLMVFELLLTNDLSPDRDDTAFFGKLGSKLSMAIVIGVYLVLIAAMYWATGTVPREEPPEPLKSPRPPPEMGEPIVPRDGEACDVNTVTAPLPSPTTELSTMHLAHDIKSPQSQS